MDAEETRSLTIDYWRWELPRLCRAAWLSATGMILGIAVGLYVQDELVMYLSLFGGLGYIVIVMLLMTYFMRRSPSRVEFGGTGLRFVHGSLETNIPFSDVDTMKSPINTSGYVDVFTSQGHHYFLGPGCGGDFGRALLERYSEWLKAAGRGFKSRRQRVAFQTMTVVSRL